MNTVEHMAGDPCVKSETRLFDEMAQDLPVEDHVEADAQVRFYKREMQMSDSRANKAERRLDKCLLALKRLSDAMKGQDHNLSQRMALKETEKLLSELLNGQPARAVQDLGTGSSVHWLAPRVTGHDVVNPGAMMGVAR